MTPNEITTVLAADLDKVFDVPFRLMLMERVNIWRARHIKNTLDKSPADRKFFRSTVYLSTTETNEVPCSLPFDQCKVYVTTTIPEPLRANSMLFDYVGAVNGLNPFVEVSPGTAFYRMSGKYSKNKVAFNYSDQKIFVFTSVPMIRIDFIAAWPEQLDGFNCDPSENTCDYWNSQYPCPPEILQLIFQSIREIDFKQNPQLFEQSVPVNPANDSTR